MDCAYNIITANFSGGKTHATTARVYQWSRGIELCITGADNLPQTFKAHFSVQKKGGVATTIVGIDERVTVPNVLFTIGKDIHVWLGASETEDDAEILYTVDIPVAPAPMPEYYDAEDTGVFDAVVEQVSGYAATATAAANSAGASATAAAGSASAAAQSAASIEGDVQIASQKASEAQTAAGQAVTAKGAAVTAQQGAETAATNAGQSASTATTKAAEAATSASNAAQSKTDAETAAARAEQAAASLTVDSALSDSSTNPVQNKVITGALTDVKSALSYDSQSMAKLLRDSNLIIPVECVDNAYINASTGEPKFGDGYFCTGFIPVTSGSIYKANVGGRNKAWFDANKNYIDGATDDSLANGFTIPTDAYYIRFTVKKNNDNIDNPYDLYCALSTEYDSTIVIDGLVAQNAQKAQNAENAYNIPWITRFPNNLVIPSECVDNAYINTTTGAEKTNQPGYFCTGFIPVTAGSVYKANVSGRAKAWYNASKEYIDGSSASSTSLLNGWTIPSGAYYIRFSVKTDSDDITNPLDLYCALLANYDTTISLNNTLKSDVAQWCYSKKINWIGDSIVDGTDFDENVCAALGLAETDYGINGSTIALKADGTDSRDALCVRYANMSNDADIIAVSCGTNDYMYAWCPIGTINDSDDGTSNTTFYGALKTLCKGLIDKYPQKVIFFTTPIKRAQAFESGNGGEYTQDGVMTTPFSKNKYGKTLMDYADMIKEVCGYYSIPVLDMYRESLLNPHIASQQDLFDNVYTHPNAVGKKIMARRVAGWLTQLAYTIK